MFSPSLLQLDDGEVDRKLRFPFVCGECPTTHDYLWLW